MSSNDEGLDKSALLLLTLGSDEAAEVLKQLGPKEVQKLGAAMAAMPAQTREHVESILDELLAFAEKGTPIEAEWGVVGCLYTMQPEEIPMAPVTMMRNALGVDEGGSGVPLDREAYRRSVEFWDANANWRP